MLLARRNRFEVVTSRPRINSASSRKSFMDFEPRCKTYGMLFLTSTLVSLVLKYVSGSYPYFLYDVSCLLLL